MKPLVVGYSLTENTKKICGAIAKGLKADYVELHEIRRRSVLNAYTLGCFAAMKRKNSDIKPVAKDVSAYDCLVVASPVWAGCIVPAVNDFLREYALKGKTIYGLVDAAGSFGKAPAQLREEIEAAGAVCPNVVELLATKELLHNLKAGRKLFAVEDGKLVMKDGAPE